MEGSAELIPLFMATGFQGVGALEPQKVQLKDGGYLLRPLHAGDEEVLRGFFYSHTPETVYYRYGYALRDMTPERARELVNVDQNRDPALGIFGVQGKEAGQLFAVGRYYLNPSGDTGEVAFVTHERKRGCGMATLLLMQLVRIARSRSLRRLVAQVLIDNVAMLRVFDKMGFTRLGIEDGDWQLEMDLHTPAKR